MNGSVSFWADVERGNEGRGGAEGAEGDSAPTTTGGKGVDAGAEVGVLGGDGDEIDRL